MLSPSKILLNAFLPSVFCPSKFEEGKSFDLSCCSQSSYLSNLLFFHASCQLSCSEFLQKCWLFIPGTLRFLYNAYPVKKFFHRLNSYCAGGSRTDTQEHPQLRTSMSTNSQAFRRAHFQGSRLWPPSPWPRHAWLLKRARSSECKLAPEAS